MTENNKIIVDKLNASFGDMRVKYCISSLEDNTGLVLHETYNGQNVAVRASILDCGEYIVTTVRLNDKQFFLSFRIPAKEKLYECELTGKAANKKNFMVSCKTSCGHVLNAHPAFPDYESKCFNGMEIGMEAGDKEYSVATIIADKDTGILCVSAHGYAAGYEIQK